VRWADVTRMGHMRIWGHLGCEWWGSVKPAAMWTADGRCFVPFMLGIWFEIRGRREMSEKSIKAKSEDERAAMIQARKLRLAVVTNVWRQGFLTAEDALDILRGRLVPNDPLTEYDDSALLGVIDALDRIE